MVFIKTTALCALALAAMVLPDHQADAHAFLLLPKTEFITPNKNLYAYTIPGKSVPPENAYFTGNAERNSEGFKKNYAAGNYKTLKDFIFKTQQPSGPYKDRPNGGTAECGFSIPTATPQPLPNQIEYGNYNLQNREGIHPGPCEAWCDDEIVIPFTEDCRKILFKPIPYAKDKCVGKSRFTFYWVATHFAPFQVYTSCVPLQGATGGGNTATSKTPKATTRAPMSNNNNNNNNNKNNNNNNNKNNNNNNKVGADADPVAATNSTSNASSVKCKVRKV